jgi:hypothetical protein
MLPLQAEAILCALIVPIACSGTRTVGLPGNPTHASAARPMPPTRLVVNAKEYRYDIVGVTLTIARTDT